MNLRERIYLNDNWGYTVEYKEELLSKDFDVPLEQVRLPHTTVETPFHYFDESIYQKNSAYRRVLVPDISWKGKRVLLTIEAAGHEAEVFLNGESLIKHGCGYTAFKVNLSPHLIWNEENVLVIRVDSHENLNVPPFGHVIDYMTYGGLYREVYLDICPETYITDVFAKVMEVRAKGEGIYGDAVVECEVCLEDEDQTRKFKKENIRQTLYDQEGNKVVEFEAGKIRHELRNVKLWSVDHPALYVLETKLMEDGELLDVHHVRIGIRTVVYKQDGLYLNGHKYKFRGLNRHQSYPYVGYAMPKSMQREDAKVLKYELGLNAVRTSHYPQSHHFLDCCDEIGLLVFTEIPGWQHIGNEEWKEQAVKNTEEMVLQYRNHPSIFLWGVRINESTDDDELYTKTNKVAHELDSTRQTSGVRYLQKSSLLEDVYSYNDFSHNGTNDGCVNRRKATPDNSKGYLISEYNGHMFPTKSFDNEDHRTDHLLRHAKVVDAYYGHDDIGGGFGWCMADYNTHKDFGSGDRICYHGVLDMFRNHKPAAAVYATQAEGVPVLEVSSSMDIGEHPGGVVKEVYVMTNADSVRLYKNKQFIKEFDQNNRIFKNMPYGPILIDDFIGELLEKGEGFSHEKAEEIKKILIAANKFGLPNLPMNIKMLAAKCILLRGMSMDDAVKLYNKYVANWGADSIVYRFEAIKDGEVVAVCEKAPMKEVHLQVDVSHTTLVEDTTYDVAAVRIKAVSERGNILPYYQEPIVLEVEGGLEIVGPTAFALKGGMGGTYVRTTGVEGKALLRLKNAQTGNIEIEFDIQKK